jgi:hypothetical protein
MQRGDRKGANMQQWSIGIRGKQRQDYDVDLLIQAVVALGQRLREARQAETEISEVTEQDTGERRPDR